MDWTSSHTIEGEVDSAADRRLCNGVQVKGLAAVSILLGCAVAWASFSHSSLHQTGSQKDSEFLSFAADPVVSLAETTDTADGDKAIKGAGVMVKIKGQSGKMTITLPNSTTDVECQMVALRQLDASGNTLGGGGSEKHSFQSFATQSFTFSEPTDAMYSGIQVSKITFESTLVGSSKVKIDTLIFKEAGDLKVGNDTLKVAAGAVKFNVKLDTWSWCGEGGATCKGASGDGVAVELDISVAAKGQAPKQADGAKGQPESFNLGDGSSLTMLTTYSSDEGNTWMPMPSGYPKLDGAKFTLRFPKWEGSVTYDPIIQKSMAAAFTAWAPVALVAIMLPLAAV